MYMIMRSYWYYWQSPWGYHMILPSWSMPWNPGVKQGWKETLIMSSKLLVVSDSIISMRIYLIQFNCFSMASWAFWLWMKVVSQKIELKMLAYYLERILKEERMLFGRNTESCLITKEVNSWRNAPEVIVEHAKCLEHREYWEY